VDPQQALFWLPVREFRPVWLVQQGRLNVWAAAHHGFFGQKHRMTERVQQAKKTRRDAAWMDTPPIDFEYVIVRRFSRKQVSVAGETEKGKQLLARNPTD
jgi:hypothetical protein